MTAPNHTLEPGAIVTFPMTVAVGAMKTPSKFLFISSFQDLNITNELSLGSKSQ
jgi:hypothetical protein